MNKRVAAMYARVSSDGKPKIGSLPVNWPPYAPAGRPMADG
jgi:hypothetical protein